MKESDLYKSRIFFCLYKNWHNSASFLPHFGLRKCIAATTITIIINMTPNPLSHLFSSDECFCGCRLHSFMRFRAENEPRMKTLESIASIHIGKIFAVVTIFTFCEGNSPVLNGIIYVVVSTFKEQDLEGYLNVRESDEGSS